MLTKKFLSHSAVITTGILIGLIGIFVRFIGDSMHPIIISFFRLFFGFLFLLIIVPFIDRTVFKVTWEDLKNYIAIGMLFAAGMCTYVYALLNAPVSNVVLLEKTYVIFVTVFAVIFLKEIITKKEFVAMAVGLVGIAFINPFEGSYLLGNLFAIFTAVLFALYIVYTRYEEKTHGVGEIMWVLLFGSIFLSPSLFFLGPVNLSANLLWLVLLGVFCTGLAYLLLNFGLKRMDAEHSSLLMMISSPLVGVATAVIVLGEQLSIKLIIGGAILIFSGIILETGKSK